MKKITKMFFAMALIMCCAMSASAGRNVVLLSANFDDGTSPMNGWGNNHTREVVDGALKITNPSAVNSWEAQMAYDFADAFLPNSEYTVTMKVRGSAPGQISIGLQNPDGYASTGEFGTVDFDVDWIDVRLKCLCNGEGGKRFIFSFGQFEGDIYIDDLELSVYEDGPTKVEDGANDDLRWANILTNSDLEGEADSSFIAVSNDPNKVDPETGGFIRGIAEIFDGEGKDGSRGIKVKSFAGAAQNWDAQFWINLPEPLAEGTQYRVTFDYRASAEVTVETQAHATPSNYLHYQMIGNPAFTTDWQYFEYSGKLDANQAGGGTFQSVAFNLSIDKEQDIEFYFDNLTFELLNNGTVPQYGGEVILMDLGRTTNIPALVAATGKSRLVYPEGCAVVTMDDMEVEIASVEAFADGRFYIFVADYLEEDSEVKVKFTNPTDPAYRIVYTDGDLSDMPDYDGIAYLNEEVQVEDAITNEYAAPVVLSIEPEDGSFNLPVDFKEIKVTFDKEVSCTDLKAFLGTEKLAVSPAEGYAEVVTLTRTSTAPLAEGDYSISIEDIHSVAGEGVSDFWGQVRYSISIGHNVAELELVVDLANMLETAKQKRDANVDELYSGVAYNNLCAIIEKYDEEYKTLTAPSVYRSVTKEINGLIVEMDAHHNLVDTYYNTVRNAVSVVDQYSASKFASMPMFTQLKEDLAKYLDELQEPIKLYLDEELQAAVDALKETVDNAAALFTTGASNNNGTGTTGIAALTERLRLGAEALMKLGVSAEDELVVAAQNALDDDDNLAEQLKYRLKLELYNAINSGKDLFAQRMDEELMEMVGETYDMTVFFKNPNIYCNNALVQETGFDPATTPGWSVPEGAGNPNVTTGWAAPTHVYTDCTFQNWGYAIGVEQTVVDLPAGIYTIKAGFGERDNAEAGAGSYLYAKNSSVPEGEVGDTIGAPVIGQSFPNLNVEVKNVVVADGMLTVGVVGSATSHIFFNNISVQIAGLADFDYKKGYDDTKAAYDEYMTGIDGTVAAPAQVLGIQLYDLNGRRIMNAQKGIVILKKFMSDGTIQVEKVIKK